MTFLARCLFVLPAIVLISCVTFRPAGASNEIPGAPQQRPIALIGGTIHPVSGPPIEEGIVLFEQGKITAIGRKVTLPRDAQQVEIHGKHVYPGLFDGSTNMGLVEINAVRATRDSRETGQLNPNVKAQVAVNPDSEIIPVTRASGVLLALTAPSGGLISGTSAVLQLDGWTYEDLTLAAPTAMHIDWPRMAPATDWWNDESLKKQAEERDEALQQLNDVIADARAYQRARLAAADRSEPLARDARWEAMLPVLRGELPVVVQADELQQIQAAVAFAAREKLRLIIYGGYDAESCAPLLKEHDVPVMLAGVHRLPLRRSDDYDAPYTLAERLRKAGVKYCITGAGRFGATNARNLGYHAATAAAYGLSKEEALRSVTRYPAEILGVADRVGTLDPGKDATLIVTNGDPLEAATQVESAYIQGRTVDLNNRHRRLYEKYREKYRQQAGK